MKLITCILFFYLGTNVTIGQIKTLKIYNNRSVINIDGIDNETSWSETENSDNFTQTSPANGSISSQVTEVKMLYDNEAIYIYAVMYDSTNTITKTLSRRDDFGNADMFGVIIDTYGASTMGFGFLITAAGVQIDEIHSPNNIDRNWNAVWYSSVKCYDDRWVAELKIPLSAFRFPNQSNQTWKANFTRHIRSKREDSNWQYYDATKLNYLSQFGNLSGIKNIKSPVRLALFPYVSGYVDIKNKETSTAFNGGMDLKYGINDAFTLDMTLVPDFGQIRFDDQILNLSPYEVRFDEFRQFFTEGVELFNKGDLFYSRRLGSQPINQWKLNEIESTEVIKEEKNNTQLVNATKFSGRTKKGLGIGILNGTSVATNVVITDTNKNSERLITTSPLTNYNVIVLDQNLNHNSSFTLVNSNVWRSGETYDANVSAILFDLYDKSERYNINGNISNSQIFKSKNIEIGQKYFIEVGKKAGKFITELSGELLDNKFDNNDLGFLQRNNYKNINYYTGYRIWKPFWRIIRMWAEIDIDYFRLHQPDRFEKIQIYSELGGAFRNFLFTGINYTLYPIPENDFFEPRTPNFFYKRPGGQKIGGFVSSNYNKPFAYDINLSYLKRFENDRYDWKISLSPRFRFNDKFSLIYSLNYQLQNNDIGLALTNSFDIIQLNGHPIFGQRNRQVTTNVLTANYIFNNKMDISFRARHYWSKVEYNNFYELQYAGTILQSEYSNKSALHNSNFNIFTVDMTYSWVFAPGSFLNIVWKQGVFNSNANTTLNYFENLNDLSQLPALNSVSVKLLYYISYQSFKQLKKSN